MVSGRLGKPAIILFDGVCVLCSSWVGFVLARDRAQRWYFVAIQSPAGRALAKRHGIDPDNPPTSIVVCDDAVLVRSDAAIAVLCDLPGYRWIGFARVVPETLRNWLYDRIALNRYRLFGRRATCMVPGPESRDRFIERVQDLPP